MKLPEPMNTITNLIDQYHKAQSERPRPHMGCSALGHPCDRWLWLNFRWAVVEEFEGRILRLFRRGQNEEEIIVRDLRNVGIDIRSSQARVNFGSHVSGSLDGIVESGIPEAPKKRHVAEFKTHSKKSFDDMVNHGVTTSKCKSICTAPTLTARFMWRFARTMTGCTLSVCATTLTLPPEQSRAASASH
jgi:hypothetical protein